jgi:hypothetical protein
MSNIFVLEATNGVGNGVHVPDVIQELVPQPFAFAGSPDETRNIEELKRRGGNLFGMNQLGQAFQPFIGHRDDPGVRIDGAEPIIRHFRSSSRKGVKDRRFSNVGKTYDSATKTHGPSGEISVSLIERELLGQRLFSLDFPMTMGPFQNQVHRRDTKNTTVDFFQLSVERAES